MVDETQAGASGCSIDKSVHFIKRLEIDYSTNFFDRLTFAYIKDEEVYTAHQDTFREMYANGAIDDSLKVFDHLVKDKFNFQHHWVKPLSESWHKRMV